MNLTRRAMAECIGTALLLAAVVGSGIMGERLAGGNVALATGAALVALILAFGAISGAHFNPLVTLAAVAGRTLGWREAPLLLGGTTVRGVRRRGRGALHVRRTAVLGCATGARRRRAGGGCAVCGRGVYRRRLLVHRLDLVHQPGRDPDARRERQFRGIRPQDVPGFVLGQLLGAGAAILFWRWLAMARTAAPADETAT